MLITFLYTFYTFFSRMSTELLGLMWTIHLFNTLFLFVIIDINGLLWTVSWRPRHESNV
jgi:hypothetical protein